MRATKALPLLFSLFLIECVPSEEEPVGATCGNNKVETGETCDGNCPTTCEDQNVCTQDLLQGSAGSCNVTCDNPPIRSCTDDDGCCPAGCDGQDNDCHPPLRLDAGLASGTSTFDNKLFTPLLPYLSAGEALNSDEALRTGIAIANTTFDELYQREVWVRSSSASFTVPAQNGAYTVHFHFADWHPTDTQDPGDRVFHLDLQGTRVSSNFDIIAEVGKDSALVRSFDTTVTDGTLQLTVTNQVFYAQIAGIEILSPGQPPLATSSSTTTPPQPPAAPDQLTATAASVSAIDVAWRDQSDNEERFVLQMRQGSSGSFSDLATLPADTTAHPASGLQSSTEYCFRVRAANSAGPSAHSNEACATTLPVGPVDCDYFVALGGDDGQPGTEAEPFASLAGAQTAIRALKQGSGLPSGGVTVCLRAGTYPITQTVTFSSDDSGTSASPITYAAYPGETVRLTGGRSLEPGWFSALPGGSAAYNRIIATNARDQVVQVDLSAHGISDYGTLVTRGFSDAAISGLELAQDGEMMQLARWPNAGQTDTVAANTDAIVAGNLSPDVTGTYSLVTTPVTGNADDGYPTYRRNGDVGGETYFLYHCSWLNSNDPYSSVHKYWFLAHAADETDLSCWPSSRTSWGRAGRQPIPHLGDMGGSSSGTAEISVGSADAARDGYLRIPSTVDEFTFVLPGDRHQQWSQATDIQFHGLFGNYWGDDTIHGTVSNGQVTLQDRTSYPLKAGQPFYVLNLLEEIDEPGEYYLDRSNGMLYFYPVGPIATSELQVSMMSDPLLVIDGASHLRFEDLIFEMSRGRLVELRGTDHVVLHGVTARNSGADAIRITGSDNSVERSRVYNTGARGVYLSGGDRASLTPGNNVVRNSEIYNFGRWEKTYREAVRIYGAGNVVEHNYLHDAPHSAILFNGNDHRIEYNRIERVVQEANDAGAIYTGRDWGYRGNLIRYNFIRDIVSVFHGSHGVYLDDAASGITVDSNIFYNIHGRATMSGGGRDNLFRNNIIVNAESAHSTDRRGRTSNYEFNSGCPDDWNLLGRINFVYSGCHSHHQAIAYQSAPWSTRYPALAAIPNDWGQVQDSHWQDPEGCIFSRNLWVPDAWRTGQYYPLMTQGNWGGSGAPDHYAITDNLETQDPQFVDEANMNLNLEPTSPAFTIPGFVAIPFDDIGIQ